MKQLSLFGETDEVASSGDTKICIKCNLEKDIKLFPWRDRGAYRRTECKDCLRHLTETRNKLKAAKGLPPEGYVCPVCLNSYKDQIRNGGPKNTKTPWVLDHCHNTDKFRGWLCQKCNRSLGGFNDDAEVLRRAIDYLKV